MISLDRRGEVFVLTLDEGENRFHPDLLAAVEGALATVEGADGPRALVTAGTGKFFSNGLDLDWLAQHPAEGRGYVPRVQALFARLLSLPCPSVAALNGHAFAAGAMLALCHDHRVMRADRGYVCLPEVDLGMPFTPGMNALIRARLPMPVAHEAMVTGRRYGGEEARAAGIVDRAVAEDDVLTEAIALAGSLAGKAGPAIAAIRSALYGEVLEALVPPG